MNAFVTLQADEFRCEINPTLGGCITGLWLDDVPVLRSTLAADLHAVRQSASFPLVPFSNRVGNACLHWQGNNYSLIKNFEPEPHAIHGVGWQRSWQVLESDSGYAKLSYAHKADTSWPFDFVSTQIFKLSANTLELSINITNPNTESMPAGLGWHPYFARRAGSHIQFDATGRWEMGLDKLPTHRVDHAGLNTDATALTVDHCFDGWRGELILQDAILRTSVSSDLSRLVVYTTPEQNFIAIEPVSHVNNALNLLATSGISPQALGIVILQPGGTYTGDMRIEVQRL